MVRCARWSPAFQAESSPVRIPAEAGTPTGLCVWPRSTANPPSLPGPQSGNIAQMRELLEVVPADGLDEAPQSDFQVVGDLGILIDDVVLVPAVLGLAEELRRPRLLRVAGLDGDDQVPEVGPDGELGDVHAEAGVVADLGLLAADQREQVVAVDRRVLA